MSACDIFVEMSGSKATWDVLSCSGGIMITLTVGAYKTHRDKVTNFKYVKKTKGESEYYETPQLKYNGTPRRVIQQCGDLYTSDWKYDQGQIPPPMVEYCCGECSKCRPRIDYRRPSRNESCCSECSRRLHRKYS